jgi:hypothetical protein
MVTTRRSPGCETTTDLGRVRSASEGTSMPALTAKLLRRKTRRMVIMSIMAVMFRPVISSTSPSHFER